MNRNKYSKRFRRIVALIVVACVLVFVISIKPTINLSKEVESAGAIGKTEDLYAKEYEGIAKERVLVDRYFSNNTLDKSLDDELFATISSTIDTMGVYLSQYPPVHNVADKGFTLITQEVVVYGEYIPLLKFMGVLEKDTRFFIHSAAFSLETDRRTDVQKLLLKLYIQSILNRTL